MRLLHIISTIDPKFGGVSQALYTMIKGLSELSVVNEVVTVDNPDADYLSIFSSKVHALGPSKSSWHYSSGFLPWLKEYLHTYDLVIVHGLWQYHTYAVYKVWSQLDFIRPKLFVMPHGMLDPWFQRSTGRQWKALRNKLFWKLNEHKIVNYASGILFTCEMEKKLAKVPFNSYLPKLEEVIGLGVEPSPNFTSSMRAAFFKKCKGLVGNYILFISRIHNKKGVDLLINAYLFLKSKGNKLPQLVIAGPGLDTVYGQQMLKLAESDTDILFCGMLIDDAKWGAFYGCEAFILPSHQENFGVAVVEALSCGKPVLISNQVNIWEEIHLGNGGIVADDTLQGTQLLLKSWSELSDLNKKKMADSAYDVYKKNFSIESISRKMYQTLIE